MKKIVALGLATVMISSTLLAGCGKKEEPTNVAEKKEVSSNFNATGDKIVNDPVTLKIAYRKYPDGPAFEGLQFFDEYEAQTNVKIEWDEYQIESWKEKKSLLFASNQLPDAFYGSWVLDDNEIAKYGDQGYLVPLEGYIDQYGLEFKKILARDEQYKKLLYSPDGHIYGLPSVDETTGGTNGALLMNNEWLKAVGKEVPTTTDEFYEVLKAFKEAGDLNGNGKLDEMPFSFRYDSLIQGLYAMFGAWGITFERDGIMVKDGEVSFGQRSDGYREGLEYFHKLYSEGLLDPEGFTQDGNAYRSKFSNPEKVYGAGLAWSQTWLFGTSDESKTGYTLTKPLKGPHGDNLWLRRPGGFRGIGSFAITKDCKNPEVAFRWIDGMYSDKQAIQGSYGMIGQALEKQADGTYKFKEVEGKSSIELSHEAAPTKGSLTVKTLDIDKLIAKSDDSLERSLIREAYAPFTNNVELFPKVTRTSDETEELSTLATDITSYTSKMAAQFIVEGITDESWNAYKSKLQDLGVERYLEIYNQMLARFNSN